MLVPPSIAPSQDNSTATVATSDAFAFSFLTQQWGSKKNTSKFIRQFNSRLWYVYIQLYTYTSYTSYTSICTWWYSSFFRSSACCTQLASPLHACGPAAATRDARDAWRKWPAASFQWIKTSCSQFPSHQFKVNQPYSCTHIIPYPSLPSYPRFIECAARASFRRSFACLAVSTHTTTTFSHWASSSSSSSSRVEKYMNFVCVRSPTTGLVRVSCGSCWWKSPIVSA